MGKLILVIDDSPTVCKIVEAALQRLSYEVLCFLNGEAAIRWLSSPSVCLPDLIFVDLILPQMDGYSVIRHLRAQPTFRHVPIVILSRKDGMLDQLRGRLVGATNYIVKPFTVNHLVAVVQSHRGNASMTELVPV